MAGLQDLGKKMRAGAVWIYALGWIETVVGFGSGIVLARLLDPADFGVFVAATSYSAIILAQVRFGIHASLIQSKSVDDNQWNSAFWFLFLMAFISTIAMVVIGLLTSRSYNDSRYIWVMLLTCVNYFLIPFQTINGTMLRRNLIYGTISQIQINSLFATTAFSIAGACVGMGPFSFVVAGIFGSIVLTALLYRVAPWRPRLAFSWESLKPLLRYGWRLHFNNSLSMLANRVDNMIIGATNGMAELGIYNRAFSLSRMPLEQVVYRLYELFFTGLSRIQDDLSYSILMYRKILCAMSSAAFPLLLALMFLADGFVYNLYGDRWMACVFPLKIMIVGSFAYLICTTLGALADAQALVAKETPVQVLHVAATIMAVTLGSRWGLAGVAAGIATKDLVLLFLMKNMLRRSHVGIGWAVLVSAVYPAALSTACAAAGGWATAAFLGARFRPESLVYMAIVGGVIFALYAVSWLLIVKMHRGNAPLQASALLFQEAATAVAYRLRSHAHGRPGYIRPQRNEGVPTETPSPAEEDCQRARPRSLC
jgi:O-antigen/teichoic acid export membrane protein